jgi:hypothetical protein
MTSPTFWHTVATYCRHIAPVATDVCAEIGHLANAIESARTDLVAIPNTMITLTPLVAEFDVAPTPRPRKASKKSAKSANVV